MSDTRVVVLSGGATAERDVSIRSGRRIASGLRDAAPGFEVIESDLDMAFMDLLREDPPDCVIPMLHGREGEDGVIADLLGALGIPYVGSDASACRLSFDKPVAATLLARAGLHAPASMVVPLTAFRELGAASVMAVVEQRIGLPLVVKPTRGGSSLGVEVVLAADELPSAMVRVFAYGDVALIQKRVVGVEVAVSVVETSDGLSAFPVVEIVPDRGFYDYESRYTAGLTEFFVPARLSDSHAQAARDAALAAHRILGLRDWSRTDLIIDDSGTPWFLEVNVAPGMTETSLFPQAVAAAGQDLGAVTRALVEQAIAR